MTQATTDTWLNRRERGTLLGIAAVHRLATLLGRCPTRVFVRLAALWYVLARPDVARVSRAWLTAVHGHPASFGQVYAHVRAFAQVTVDRMFFLRGKLRPFVISRTGHQYLDEAIEAGRGAILLGAHLGSFEALRADGEGKAVPINILGHFENAKRVNALFDRLNPSLAARVIHIGSSSIDFIFQVKEAIDRGEFVGTMGDRVGLNEKSVEVDFLGRRAQFPTGPFLLASVLKCPVFLTFGLYREPNRYDLFCEPFAHEVFLPRKGRQEKLQTLVQSYARRLEEYCRKAPDNWFNFYSFWASQE